MGYDYNCPTCGGPAYRTGGYTIDSDCEACRNGLPRFYDCIWCDNHIYSTTRLGGKKCLNHDCSRMICEECSNKETDRLHKQYLYCPSCYKKTRTLEEKLEDLYDKKKIIEQSILKLEENIARKKTCALDELIESSDEC